MDIRSLLIVAFLKILTISSASRLLKRFLSTGAAASVAISLTIHVYTHTHHVYVTGGHAYPALPIWPIRTGPHPGLLLLLLLVAPGFIHQLLLLLLLLVLLEEKDSVLKLEREEQSSRFSSSSSGSLTGSLLDCLHYPTSSELARKGK